MNNAFVCIMGIGVVFLGLICLIFITYAMSEVCKNFEKKAPQKKIEKPTAGEKPAEKIQNKQEIIAASCAVIAEELGTDVSNIRVTSFKKL